MFAQTAIACGRKAKMCSMIVVARDKISTIPKSQVIWPRQKKVLSKVVFTLFPLYLMTQVAKNKSPIIFIKEVRLLS